MAGLFNKVPTDLDLNGPILSITTEPTGATGIGTTVGATGGASVTITGIATAVVGSSGTGGTGFLSYQWYEEGVGALSDGTYITGTASTGTVGSTATLTLSNLITPTDNDRKFYLEVDYVPSYVVGVQSVTVPGFKTGNAFNEPITSGVATVTVTPLVEITTQPVLTSTFPNIATDITVVASLSDTSFADDTQYQWQLDSSDVSNGTITKNSVDTVVSGATTPTLTLTSNNSGISYNVRCNVSSATASNSLIVSDSVIYTVNVPTNGINVESIKNAGTLATLSSPDLDNGDFTINAETSSTADDFFLYSLYAPNKDIDVEMDLYGGKGASATDNDGVVSSYEGGEGGYSRIRFTMKQNEEYVIAGLTTAINAPYVYHKGTLIACVGQGGQAGLGAKGGDGGGLSISGSRGGNNGGYEGNALFAGNLGANGAFGSAFGQPSLVYSEDNAGGTITFDPFQQKGGGIPIKCTKGVYWAQQGIAACADVGTVKFRLSGGEEVTNTTDSITRGYKSGYNIIQTAGEGAVGINAARGGNGCRGGSGGGGRNSTPNNSGGGGGGGYTDGSITEVVSTAGGSTGDAKVVLRLQT